MWKIRYLRAGGGVTPVETEEIRGPAANRLGISVREPKDRPIMADLRAI